MEQNKIAGFLLINKPQGISSFDVVRHIKKILGRRTRVGHTGTLDPFANGLLIIAIDRSATRQSEELFTLNKTYIAKAKLGEQTDTLDLQGTIIQKECTTQLVQNDLEKAVRSLGTRYTQIPPVYSALKHEGKPLYELARSKRISQQKLEAIAHAKQKEVILHELTLLTYKPPFFTIRAHVSHGTYIRVLVNDIAQKVGTSATTYELERTAIGSLTVEDAVTLEQLSTRDDIVKHLIRQIPSSLLNT